MQLLFPAWEQNIPALGTKCSHTGNKTALRLALSLLLMFVLGINTAWGQETHPYAGVWYMQVKKNPAYYMVPAANPQVTTANHVNEDAYFSSNYSTQAGDPEKPFVTTYQTSGDLNSIWIFVPVSGENNYYYIVHAKSGKYIKYQTYLTGDNARRKYVHLETMVTPGETEKFEITALNVGVKIKPKNNTMYFNVAGDNQSRYNGGTTSPYYSGMVGGMTGTDDNSQFKLIDASSATTLTPVISDLNGADNTFTITSPAAAFSTIRYTTDGSTTPDASTGTSATSGSPITITGNWSVQAVGVFDSFVTPVAGPKELAPAGCSKPIITYDNSSAEVSITCPTADATIYYTTDGTEPTTSSTEYSSAISVSDGMIIKAIATKSGLSNSDIASLIIVLNPTITIDGGPFTYNGTQQQPAVTVKKGETVIDPSEYTISYSNNINVGSSATVTITDNEGGEYYVVGSTTFTISPMSIGSGNDPVDGITIDVMENGESHSVTVKHNGNTLTQDTDYTWTGNTVGDDYEVTVTGMGNYTGSAKAQYIPVTPGYYVLHQNGKGYLKVSGAGVNLGNDETFQSGNLFDKGNCIWYMTPEGYLQNEYFYLNAANNNTLYLSVNPVTRWRSEDVTGENTNGKKHLKINNGTEDVYLCNDNNSITLKNNPSAYYSACPVDVEEVENSWAGPTADNLTVQSPQLVTYLRAYFTQKIKYNFHNDAGAEVKSTDGKHERRVYATIAYKEGGDGKGTNWDIDESGILYNKKASGDVEFTATYNILPADPVVRAAHSTAATKSIKYKVTQKPLALTANMDYLLFSISGGDSNRYPYDDGVADGNPVIPNGKGGMDNSSVLTDPDTNKNMKISWKITADAEGFYTFQNSNTSKYLYFDETPHASSDYGVLRLGDAPTGNSAKFRLYKTSDSNYGECYYIIPYSKLFAVYKSDGLANGLYVALNNKDYASQATKVISLFKPNANSIWCIYKYEAEYRIREDFTITGPSTVDALGDYEFTSEGWYGKYIKQSPKNGEAQNRLVIKGTYKNGSNIDYQWTVTSLGTYINITDGTNTDGTWTKTTTGDATNRKLVINVTSLPVSSTSGVIKLKLSGCSAPSENVKTSSEKTFAFTIFGDGTVSFTEITSLSQITSSSGVYRLVGGESSNFAYSVSNKPGVTTFSGILDGNNQTISDLSAPLFDNLSNGTVHNVNISGVNISSHSGPTGAIAGTADGGSRIYNVGVLGGEVGSSDDVCGGLVGKLDGSARVINCFSYATITGGTTVGGIVGNNTYASKSNDMRTMVMNCMFYGDITGGSSKAPIYNGQIITNRSDQNGVSNFNYFWAGASYVQNQAINVYNCALAAETRFLQRFEFYRPLLNSNRALAAWWATGSRDNKDEMLKWVMEPSQIGSATPYPILKPFDKYPSVVNIDADHAEAFSGDDATKKTQYNQGRKFGSLTINIQNASSGAPDGADIIISPKSVTPNITDKDPAHFNFNYYKVQLPYYNDVGTKNYTDNKVVTGWKIVSMSKSAGSFTTGSDATATANSDGDITLSTPYNFADRNSTVKDIYSETNKRVFNQGAYFDVPEGVTSITIEPYWGKCVYVADAYPDVVYNQDMSAVSNVNTVGGGVRYTNNTSYSINGSNQIVYTKLGGNDGAVNALNPSGTVYDNAIVLVGNVHSLDLSNKTDDNKPYTIMSIDLDKDNEPDYSYILRFNDRVRVHPVRVDFLNVIGLGMAQKSTGGSGTYNLGIMQPLGWFECTNTGLFRVTQFEYDRNPRKSAPMILHGGVIEQWVTVAETSGNVTEANAVDYYHVGSNVWFKEFHIGAHQDRQQIISPHPPISVTGGDFDIFYLTGMYNTPNTNYDDNAECYINGGRFGKVAGTGMQGIGGFTMNGTTKTSYSNGNIIWQIDNADIDEFYAGGINAAHIAEGNIWTVIRNSRVDQFCGGPKFGNMNSDKKVVTNATNCTFRTFFGAGYGGNSYNREYPTNKYNDYNYGWNTWLKSVYKKEYKDPFKGVSTRIDYQFIPKSDNTLNVGRLFVDYISFSLATTHDVTSKLTDCTITTSPLGRLSISDDYQCLGSFYGGGSLGMVDGPVKSTLTNCTVEGNVFGGGYSATLPTVQVMNDSFQREPSYDTNTGAYTEAILPTTESYTWEQVTEAEFSSKQIDTGKNILYTTENLTGLGAVTGNVTLTIDGNTTLTDGKRMSVAHSVYGGGEESNVEGNTQVNITGGTITENVFGGGKGEADEFSCSKAMVGVNNAGAGADLTTEENKNKGTKVTISNGTVNGNVYGGGEVGRVEWNTQVTIGAVSGGGTPIVNGSVFGAGAGVATHGYAALVRGNSYVTIQGNAKVIENVYGGGEQATVGRYWVKGINNVDSEGNPIPSAPSAPTDMPDEMPYKTMSGGQCTVTVQGNAQVGPDDGATATAGHVFGAGKGVTPHYVHTGEKANWSRRMVDYNSTKHTGEPGTTWDYYEDNHAYVWEYFATEDKYFEFLQTLALVTGTDVTIGGGTVKGNVYGGSESGFVQDDTDVKVTSGTIGTSGTTTNGNVFGGGKGLSAFAEAGKVKGTTKVAINNGAIKGNVYGGGELGDVGLITKPADYNYTWKQSDGNTVNTAGNNDITDTNNNTGICTVTISGGTIGTSESVSSEHGNVFGAGKGEGTTFWCEKAIAFATNVSVNGGTVHGNVYGGGQIGRVEDDAKVTIGGASAETGADIKGSVFGAGAGLATHGYSALVRGNTIVTVDGYAKVAKSVYGGGETASVGRYGLNAQKMPNILVGGGECELIVQGNATIGEDVFGACKGVTPAYNNTQGDDNRSKRMVTYDPDREVNPHVGGTQDSFWNYYDDDHRFVWEYFTTSEAYSQYLETLALATHPEVTIAGSATVGGSVYGGGKLGLTKGSVIVNIQGGTIEEDVYGGGALADTNTTELVADNYPTTSPTLNEDGSIKTKQVHPTTTVNLTGGLIKGDAYGGGLGAADAPAYVHGDVLVDLNGTTTKDANTGKPTTTGTPLSNSKNGCVVSQIFGCNNVNGSPKGNVMVHVYATQNKDVTNKATIADKFVKDEYSNTAAVLFNHLSDTIVIARQLTPSAVTEGMEALTAESDVATIKTALSTLATSLKNYVDNSEDPEAAQNDIDAIRYDVKAVYGGGNQAAYVPYSPYTTNNTTGAKTQVIIEGCGETSIETVYGGGNAAAVPETNVEIREAYEIHYAFGGGNGKSTPSFNNPGADVGIYNSTNYGSGNANLTLKGGYIHEIYGGSNEKGNIIGTTKPTTNPEGDCDLEFDKMVGAGKNADIDGNVDMILDCMPSKKTPLLFAGADNANVNGHVNLTITNGTFGQVFCGNNAGGAIMGYVQVNVEETGCQPIVIDELYTCGNQAAYSVYGYKTGANNKLEPQTEAELRAALHTEHPEITDDDEFETLFNNTKYKDPEVNIISCTSIGKVFGGGYGTRASVYGNPIVNINMIPGRYANSMTTDAASNSNKLGEIGEVFGGGNAADVYGSTTVNIGTTGTVYLNSEPTYLGNTNYSPVTDTEDPHYGMFKVTTADGAYITGTVYGGGCQADIKGNTNVTMSGGYVFNGIFGGGYAGNVGTFTRSTDSQYTSVFGHTAHEGCIGKPISCAEGTGKCTVLVNGGQIGPIEVATQGMNRPKAQGGPVPEGWVWGAGQGLIEDPAKEPDTHFKSYVGSTDVTIGGTAFVLESIIGGGEFGRVLGNTLVKIEGGQIGVGAGKVDTDGKPIRYDDDDFINPSTATAAEIEAAAAKLAECSHFPYGKTIGGKKQYLPYDPYYDDNKTYADAHDLGPASTSDPSDGKTWIGCVFAGGSGYMPYLKKDNNGNPVGYDWCSSAGLVEGNTNLTISGGHILTNVYGGNEVTNVKGTCKVTMTGGTIGVPRTVDQIINHPLTCYLFGAGKGDPRPHFNTETNVQDVEIDISGGIIYGSVFGGGEDGHVERNVKMTIGKDDHTGPIIGTWGTTYVDGNIFGGGRGFSGDAYTAGNVAGSVDLKIKGGTMLGSIYGGGRLGSVGYGLYPPTAGETYYGAIRPDNTGDDAGNTAIADFKRGYVDIEISGGTIGNTHEYIIPSADNTPSTLTIDDIATWTDDNWKTWTSHNNIPLTEFDKETYRLKHTKGGNVFAGGMGRLYQLDGTSYISDVDWWKLGCVKSTKLTITGGTIKSNVYGGGELGQVVGYHTTKNAANESINASTEIIIQDDNTTIIGTEVKDGSNNTQYTFGSVFGGGYGSLIEKIEVQRGTSTISSYPKFIAGFVKEDTKIDMQDGEVKACIYGGGEMASVGESTTSGETTTVTGSTYVAISGGTVGIAPIEVSGTKRYFGGAKMGNVYGGGSGHGNTVRSGRVLKNTNVTIKGGTIYHNVYGGGAYGTVGEFKYTEDPNNYNKVIGVEKLKTSGTGVATVTITGGTIGYDGKENGMVFGSSRGDVNAPNERDDHTAWVYDANVTIGTQGSETGPAIKGSVYGSGENGHTFHNTDVKVHSGTIGITDTSIDGGAAYAYRGNVYGGGCGTDKYYEDPTQETHDGNGQLYNPLAGIVYGNATVTMDGGHVVHNVYGAGAMGSVGKASDAASGKTTINISGGRIGYDGEGNGHVFGAARGDLGVSTAASNLANVRETEVNINYATTPAADNEGKTVQLIAGSVFGGGEAGTVKGSVAVNMTGGLILKDIYGGGALADTQTAYSDNTSYTTTVNLLDGTIGGDAYGGGLGQKTGFNGGTSDIEAMVYGDVTVNLGTLGTAATNDSPAIPASATAFNISYEDTDDKDDNNNYIQVVGSGRVFGCNNLNGSPQGDVTVNVYKTVAGNVGRTVAENPTAPAQEQRASRDANVPHTYELAAVYGGGNLADYTATGKKASVIIHSCDVSVQHVYGGGNAAAVPETDVLVKGAWEIDHVFGGGNGKDKFKKGNQWILNEGANVSGNTNTLLIGGYIHEAYGGSNEKGTIGRNVTINTNSEHEDCACDLELVKLYGAGKNADIEGDLIVVLGCAPETKTEEVYGGAENANVRGNVELTITSGTFGKVFGGNNQSGAIFGHIILNIEETGCRPINIDELYGCGNNAAYSVYGYKNGGTDWEGFPIYVPRTSTDDGTAVTFDGKPHTVPDATTGQYDDPEVNIISCTRIGKVFGGGLGSGATVYGNPTVNIDQIYGKAYRTVDNELVYDATATTLGEIGDVFGGGNKANVVGNTNVNIGTKKEVWLHQSVDANGNYTMDPANTGSGNGIPVVGANITGNVYGGGNEAEVTGDTNVNIGKKSE